VSIRIELIEEALRHLGEGPRPEWLGYHWCGMFALACLHEIRLALDIDWKIGSGFLLENPNAFTPIHAPAHPRPGDIGVQSHAPWHHVIVVGCDGSRVQTIAGNTGASPGKVGCASCKLSDYAWYSIEPLEAVP
jgi:hypothetical protein